VIRPADGSECDGVRADDEGTRVPEEDRTEAGRVVVFRVGAEYWRIDHSTPLPRAEFLDPSGRWRHSEVPPLLFSESNAVEIVGPEEARRLGLPD
jgi:hypothetical protein